MKRWTGEAAILALVCLLAPSWCLADGINLSSFQTGGQVTYHSDAFTSYTFPEDISGSGGLKKTGEGTLILAGNNSYQGGTTANAGTLVIGSAGALPAGTSLTIGNSGATPAANVAVPEPSVFVTWTGLGIMGLIGWAWRRRQRPAPEGR